MCLGHPRFCHLCLVDLCALLQGNFFYQYKRTSSVSGGKDLCYSILLFCFKLEDLKPFRHSANYVSSPPPPPPIKKEKATGSEVLF